jgi:hypothetical protein
VPVVPVVPSVVSDSTKLRKIPTILFLAATEKSMLVKNVLRAQLILNSDSCTICRARAIALVLLAYSHLLMFSMVYASSCTTGVVHWGLRDRQGTRSQVVARGNSPKSVYYAYRAPVSESACEIKHDNARAASPHNVRCTFCES